MVTKQELFDTVWAGRVTVDKVLPNAINKLRRALGESNGQLITTQAKVGYRLDGPVIRETRRPRDTPLPGLMAGKPVPGRPNFRLLEALGEHPGSAVWRAEHSKTRERRVYKFALDDARLGSLRREATLLRVLQEHGDERHIVELIDWNFETAPYFLECGDAGQDLGRWAETGLGNLDLDDRLALFLEIVDAVALAHGLGVLHKDLKPANVLIQTGETGLQIRLSDFGSGRMLDPDRLASLGITQFGQTLEAGVTLDSFTGTPLYAAPELLTGQAPTVRSDVYALGVMLYQLLVGQMGRPLAQGWEKDIADPLLRDDIAAATDGDPACRLASAAELAQRLRTREARRAERAAAEARAAAEQAARETLMRAKARRPWMIALYVFLAGALAVTLGLQRQAEQARQAAEHQLARAAAVSDFLSNDLIGRSNPLVMAHGAEANLGEVMIAAAERVGERFADHPDTESAVRLNLAWLFHGLDAWPQAEAQARQAFERALATAGPADPTTRVAKAMEVAALVRLGRLDAAKRGVDWLEQQMAGAEDGTARFALHLGRSCYLHGTGAHSQAADALRDALAFGDFNRFGGDALRHELQLERIFALSRGARHNEAIAEANALFAELDSKTGNAPPIRAAAQVAVARSHLAIGDARTAEAMLLEAKPRLVAHYGTEHFRYTTLLFELFELYAAQGDWQRALPIGDEVARSVRMMRGDRSVATWESVVTLGRYYLEAGRPEDAERQLSEAVRQLSALLGPHAAHTRSAKALLGEALIASGRPAEALAVLDSAASATPESAGGPDPQSARFGALRAVAHAQLGLREEALAGFAASLPALRQADGSEEDRLLRLANAAEARLTGANGQ